jgi:hypothetical protein
VSGSSGKRGHRAAGWASVVVAGLVAVSIMLTAACATAGSAGVQAAGSQAPRPAVSSSGSVAMSPPQTPSSGATPPAGPERPCPGGTVTFVHHPGDPWSAHLCLRAGARRELTRLADPASPEGGHGGADGDHLVHRRSVRPADSAVAAHPAHHALTSAMPKIGQPVRQALSKYDE